MPPPTEGQRRGLRGAARARGHGIAADPRSRSSRAAWSATLPRVKGYFEGSRRSRAAGIYEGAQSVKPIKVDHVLGPPESRIPTFAAATPILRPTCA